MMMMMIEAAGIEPAQHSHRKTFGQMSPPREAFGSKLSIEPTERGHVSRDCREGPLAPPYSSTANAPESSSLEY